METLEVRAATSGISDLRIAFIATDELLQRGLESMLEELSLLQAAHRCADWNQYRRIIDYQEIDVLILADPDEDQLKEWDAEVAESGTKTIALLGRSKRDISSWPSPPDGFVLQENLTAETLRSTIIRIGYGDVPMPAELTRQLIVQANRPSRGMFRHVRLTPRERETLLLLVEGLSNKELARRLGVSTHGAKRLVASLLLKLDSPNRTTAVVTAIKAGLVESPGAAEPASYSLGLGAIAGR